VTIDVAASLAPFRCWDREVQAVFEAEGEALVDCILQNRAELEQLAMFIERAQVRSFLEIGVWTGKLTTALHEIFAFDTIAACDHGWAEACGLAIDLPADAQVFRGDSDSPEFREWRALLGHIDMVFIDGDHRYEAVKRDFEINRGFPHRFLVFHDITGSNRWTRGVRRFWEELDHGHKRKIVYPHLEAGLDHATMGIGIWSEEVLP
jgi:hypothetical protein